MQIVKQGTRIRFTRYRYIAVLFSTVVNLAVLALLFTRGPQLGVDFAGGTLVHLRFQQQTSISDIRNVLSGMGMGDSVVQDFGQEGSNEYLIRLEKASVEVATLGEQIRKAFTEKFGPDSFEIRRIEFVGPKVGEDLRRKGTWSVVAAMIMMGVYIWVRFGWSFGARFGLHFSLGAVIALLHDVLVTVGALMLVPYEFDLTVVAALLTIVGFSVNDTVVICDRIRENMRKIRREGLEAIINTSINETLSRTIITTGTAVLVLLSLFFLGGAVIRPFAFALLVGFISGVYSTIFIASPVILLWETSKKKGKL